MNRTYRIVWSECRKAFIVAGEHAKAKGKPSSSTRKAVASAVVMALAALAAEPAMAGTSCVGGGGLQTVAGADTSTCTLVTGDSLNVTGSINSGGNGVSVHNGVTAVSINNAGGTISGSGSGIAIYGHSTVSGGITNSGTISGGSSSAGIGLGGISTVSGGITSSGLISGANGIYVNNASTISGTTGILIHSGGSVSGGIINNGLITGTNYGIAIVGIGSSVDNINNSGTISGSPYGIFLSRSAITGSIINNAGGTISGTNTGIRLRSHSSVGSITNSGLIHGVWDGIRLTSGSSIGSITNNAGGIISGGSYGINLIFGSTVTGHITNDAGGTISGGTTGIRLTSSSSVGSITNSGTISGSMTGITISNSSVGSINNNTGGTISGSNTSLVSSGTVSGIYINSNSSVNSGITNSASGTISAIASGTANGGTIAANGIAINGSTVSGGITNSGTISASATNNSGFFANANAYGVYVKSGTINGDINNGGTIIASAAEPGGGGRASGIYLNGSALNGSITNSGTISGTFSGFGSSDGIYLKSSTVSGGITNNTGGTISGGNNGIVVANNSTVSGGITNSGTISGSYVGINADVHSTIGGITNNAGGTISGSHTGIYFFYSTVTGSISNSGLISGGGYGIYLSNSTVSGSITNNAGGTISGSTRDGIYLSSHSNVGGITNSGTISGGTYAVYVDGTSTLPNINITGNNTARFIGDVSAPNTDVTVKAGATFANTNAFNVNSFTVENTGIFNFGAGANTSGMVDGITVANGFFNNGTVAIADTVTGTITGNYTQSSTGTYQEGISSQSTYGRLAVSGNVVLGGSLYVNVMGSPTFTNGTITGMITGSAVSGTFAHYSTNSLLFSFTPQYLSNEVNLVIAAAGSGGGGSGGGSSGGTTTYQNAVTVNDNTPGSGAAKTLDNLLASDPGNPIFNYFIPVSASTQQISNAVKETLPLMTGGMAVATFGNLQGVNHVVQARQGENVGLSSGDGFITDQNAWVKPLGSWASQSDSNGASGYKAQTSGIVLGLDRSLSSLTRLGAAFAATHTNVNNNLGSQSAGVSSYQAVLYGSRSLDDKHTELNWQADYGTNQNNGNRNINFARLNAAASYTSDSIHVGAGIGRTLELSETTSFTPSIRADYTSIHSNGYTESGAGGLNLVVNAQTTAECIVAIDGKVTHKLSDATTLTANLGVGYDTLSKQASITAAYAGGGAAFTTMGLNPSPTIVSGGLGVVVKSSKTMELTGRYDVEARTGFTGQTASVKARWPF